MGCASSVQQLPKAKHLETNGFQGNSQIKVTEHDKHLIKKTWKIISNDMPGVGSKIFMKIFTLNPCVKDLFPFRDVTGEAMTRDDQFRGHASRFMQAVGAAVDNINDLDTAMAPLLFGLGQQHIHYKGFQAEYFDVFTVAIIQVMTAELGSRFTEEAAQAWNHVITFMIETLKNGYIKALQTTNQ